MWLLVFFHARFAITKLDFHDRFVRDRKPFLGVDTKRVRQADMTPASSRCGYGGCLIGPDAYLGTHSSNGACVRGRIENVLAFATVRGWRSGQNLRCGARIWTKFYPRSPGLPLDEIDTEAKTWSIPGRRTSCCHQVPLPTRAITILES
jgi:hypothetical protein